MSDLSWAGHSGAFMAVLRNTLFRPDDGPEWFFQDRALAVLRDMWWFAARGPDNFGRRSNDGLELEEPREIEGYVVRVLHFPPVESPQDPFFAAVAFRRSRPRPWSENRQLPILRCLTFERTWIAAQGGAPAFFGEHLPWAVVTHDNVPEASREEFLKRVRRLLSGSFENRALGATLGARVTPGLVGDVVTGLLPEPASPDTGVGRAPLEEPPVPDGLDAPRIIRTAPTRAAVIPLSIPRGPRSSGVMADCGGELIAALAARGIAPSGPIFAHHVDTRPRTLQFEVGVPIAGPITAYGRVRRGHLPATRVARAIHSGKYEGLETAWATLNAWIRAQGHVPAANSWESYLSSPVHGPDFEPPVTELIRPLAPQA
jgi:effector-binding domain-containing protein